MSRTFNSDEAVVADAAASKLREANVPGTWSKGFGALVEEGRIVLLVPGLGRFTADFSPATMSNLIDFHGRAGVLRVFGESLARQAIDNAAEEKAT